MKISDLQRQLKFNSGLIETYEEMLTNAAWRLKQKWITDKKFYMKQAEVLRYKIKRLAALQKALKKEIGGQIRRARSRGALQELVSQAQSEGWYNLKEKTDD